jgi:membrane protease YdiL (CAAX protease family)
LKEKTEINHEFPTFWQAALLILGLILLEYFVMAFLMDVFKLRRDEYMRVWGLATLLGNAFVFNALINHKQITYQKLFHNSSNSLSATIGLLILPIAMVVPALFLTDVAMMSIVETLFPLSRAQELMFERMVSSDVGIIIMVCILAPFLEEMLFRGIILRSFMNQYSTKNAIILSSLLFGAAHLNVYQFVGATTTGLLLGWLYVRTHSIWPCIMLHAFYNTSCVLYANLMEGSKNDYSEALPISTWFAAFTLAFLGVTALRYMLLDTRKPLVNE